MPGDDQTGADRVHADVVASIRNGGAPRQPENGRLARLVRDRAGHADQRRGRRDVDDRAAAAFHHAGYHRAHAQEYAALVDGGDPGPLLVVGFDADRADLDAGVVDQHADRAVVAFHGGHELAPGVRIGHVVVVVGGRGAAATQLRGELLAGSAAMSAMATLAPSRASARACAAPIPRAAPVISATLPATRRAARPRDRRHAPSRAASRTEDEFRSTTR